MDTNIYSKNNDGNIYQEILWVLTQKPSLHREIYIETKMAFELSFEEWFRFRRKKETENKNSRQMG